jgi:2,3-bisphosphoglycerate-independent phosphoglycerate mutase
MSVDNLHSKIKYNQVVLLILDGWGLSPSWGGNAISMNNPKNINSYWREYPKTTLKAFEIIAGSHGKVGNSEIGHASIGCGRIVQQDIVEIDKAIQDESFMKNQSLLNLINDVVINKTTLHLVGMLSDGAVHSHIDHIFALLKTAKDQNVKNVSIHIITDGRDSEKMSALTFITKLETKITELGFNQPGSSQIAQISTIIGRYYAMDRDNVFDRTSIAYELQVLGNGTIVNSVRDAITTSYKEGIESDEFIQPFVIGNNASVVKENDSIIFYNFRSDRMRQLVRYYCDKNYLKEFIFFRKYPLLNVKCFSLTNYHLPKSVNVDVIFDSSIIDNSLASVLDNNGLSQLHVAESEKFAHVTYFLNGGRLEPFKNEKRVIIPSIKTMNNTQFPQMRTREIANAIINGINKGYDFIVANFAAVDMMGHTGDINAASEAIRITDEEVKKVVEHGLSKNCLIIITSDHGNAEQMISIKKEDRESKHTLSPVPFILIDRNNRKNLIQSALTPVNGILENIVHSKYTLADIAPTILDVFEINKPDDMTGQSLIKKLL